MFTASRKVCHWFCWQRQQRHKVLADTSKVIASLSRRYHIHSVQSLCSKLLMHLVKCEVSSESYNELAELPHYRSSHQFQYVRFTGTWKDRHYCRKMHILTKTSKEPEMTHHTGTLSLSLQIWKHRYDDKEDQVVIPQVGLDCICLTTTHVLQNILAVLHSSGDEPERLNLLWPNIFYAGWVSFVLHSPLSNPTEKYSQQLCQDS